MADSRPATHGRAYIELLWDATYNRSSRQAPVEEFDEDGNHDVDRRSSSADTTNIRYDSESMKGSTRTERNFSHITQQPITTASSVGKDELAGNLKTLETCSHAADRSSSISGSTDSGASLITTRMNGLGRLADKPPNWTQPRPYDSDEESILSNTGATWADASEPDCDIVMSDTASINNKALNGRVKKRTHTETLGRDHLEDYADRHAKRQYCHAMLPHLRDGAALGRVARPRESRPGHTYDRVLITDRARVHMGDSFGDQVIINHNYLGLYAAMNMWLAQNTEASEKAAILRLAASIIAVALLDALVWMLLPAMPQFMRSRVPVLRNVLSTHAVLFEDALGRFNRIDLDIVASWNAFHYKVTCAFVNKPGYRRVAVAGYRIFDRTRSDRLIDPKQPPSFTDVFRTNKHFRMSIHFEWSEVSIDCCPKCGLEQVCKPGAETTCKGQDCQFYYRGMVEDRLIEELDESAEPITRATDNSSAYLRKARKKLLRDEQEHPACFSRISVSKQPCTRDNTPIQSGPTPEDVGATGINTFSSASAAATHTANDKRVDSNLKEPDPQRTPPYLPSSEEADYVKFPRGVSRSPAQTTWRPNELPSINTFLPASSPTATELLLAPISSDLSQSSVTRDPPLFSRHYYHSESKDDAAPLFDDTRLEASNRNASLEPVGPGKLSAPKLSFHQVLDSLEGPHPDLQYWQMSMDEIKRIPGFGTKRSALQPPVVNQRLDDHTANLKHKLNRPVKAGAVKTRVSQPKRIQSVRPKKISFAASP